LSEDFAKSLGASVLGSLVFEFEKTPGQLATFLVIQLG